MADSFYDEDQKRLQQSIIKLVDSEINPHCDEWEKAQIFPAHEVFKKLGDAGFLGINKPVEYGGQGLDYKFQMAALEAFGHIRSSGVGMAIGVQTDCATPALARFGSDELKRKYLAPALSGDAVACIGVSEPAGGSDVASITTKAERKGDEWVINGQKMWITNSLQADWMCLLANTSGGKAHENKTLIIVPMDTKGVVKAKKIDKMGMHSSDTGLIFFEDVRVPVSNMIGEEGMGFTYQMLQFQEERLAACLGCLTPLENAIKETIEYCRTRKAFGKPLLDNQYLHFRLAELHTELELFRAGCYAAADAMLKGENVTLLASMLKLKSGRLGREIPDSCLQFWGGMGFTNEVYVSRLYRDLRLWSIGGGADEVMLGIICKFMGTLPSQKKK
jgi:citronellyl-CoA dehydrogenase